MTVKETHTVATIVFKPGDVDVSIDLVGGIDHVSFQSIYRAGRKLNKLYLSERAKFIFAATNPPPEAPMVKTNETELIPDGLDASTENSLVENTTFSSSSEAKVVTQQATKVPYSQRPKK